MSWLEDKLGIDLDWDDVLTGVGTVIDLWDDYERKEIAEKSAKFTRQRQILDLAAFIANQQRLSDINKGRRTWMHESQRAVLEGARDYAATEAEYWKTRGAAELAMGRGRAADDALMREQRFNVQSAELAVRGAQIAQARTSIGFERAGNEMRQAQVMAQQETLEAQRSLLGVETAERGKILAARQRSVTAGLEAVQARGRQVEGVLGARVGARVEEAQMARGAVSAGLGARGMAGSFEGTAGRQIGREAGRDILELNLGAASEMAALGERQAGLLLEEQRIRSEGALGAARDAVRGSEITAEGLGLRARAQELRAEGAQVQGREAVLAAQEDLLGVEALAIESGRTVSDRQRIRDETAAEIAAGTAGLRAGAATLDEARATADLADLDLDISQIESEITAGDTAIAIADWTLQKVPDLPDYDTFFLRGAIGTILGSRQRGW